MIIEGKFFWIRFLRLPSSDLNEVSLGLNPLGGHYLVFPSLKEREDAIPATIDLLIKDLEELKEKFE